MNSKKPTNPKDLIGTTKVPLGIVPTMSTAYQALGHLEGALKYGIVNWRETGVRFSVYIDAIERHLGKLKEGEWADPVTRVPHLSSILASAGILVDSFENGGLIDDRPKSMPAIGAKLDALSGVVQHLQRIFKDEDPIHYTIDGPKGPQAPVQLELPFND